jgi:hypothetical protein
MSNSYRIRTNPGVDKSVKVLLEQEFEYLEILSLKILQSQIYTRNCSDYGVIVGRVSVNDGFGIPNAKVSIFIPITDEDSNNPIISDLYPYKTLSDLNEDGYRYNLLPYKQSHSGHVPTGTFFDREDVLTNPTLIEVYDKYYKYNAVTNESGDYMIFGVPTGSQTIKVDVDLSDIGEFSLSPQDLIRMGVATDSQVSGTKFKSSTNLTELPQIVTINRTIEVEPLWGQPEICNLGITRTDFDLSAEANIDIRPTAIFMGSLFSTSDEESLKANCRPSPKSGELCKLVAGPGEILAIRQTINVDVNGRPVLETYSLEQGGQVIDDNGTWVVDVPMNLDYVITNEFGERVISLDSKKGIPTRGKYRFKVKWNQSPSLSEPVKRGYFLVPNIKEYGWVNSDNDPTKSSGVNYNNAKHSYAFSLDWSDYGDTGTTIGNQMIQEGINCEDRFYDMTFNKVYTVSQLITQYRKGYMTNKIISIKNILDDSCDSENNKFPSNDAMKQNDIIFLLFTIVSLLFRPTIYTVLVILHILSFIVRVILIPFLVTFIAFTAYQAIQYIAAAASSSPAFLLIAVNLVIAAAWTALGATIAIYLDDIRNKVVPLFKDFKIPNLTYPDCEFCDCNDPSAQGDVETTENTNFSSPDQNQIPVNTDGSGLLSKFTIPSNYLISGAPDESSYLIAGQQIPVSGTIPNSVGAPYPVNESDNIIHKYFTSDLPLPERLNLFNTKGKYFDSLPGGGVNQIKVRFSTDLNSPIISHTDNVLAIVVQPSSLSKFAQGQMVSFQNVELSSDPNFKNVEINEYGFESITGTPLMNSVAPTPITVTYANPNGSGNLSVVYNVTGNTVDNECKYARYPMDVEYFQVITGMTFTEYQTLVSTSLSNSLYSRFLWNDTYIDRVNLPYYWNGCVDQASIINPMYNFSDYGNQGIIFLVRGVDPNSSRTKCEYDLSKLFGYSSFGTIKVSGDYKLNVPIQGTPLNVKHDTIIDNNMSDFGYSNLPLFYRSNYFLPGSQMSGFTTTLPSYYSSLDNDSVTPTNSTVNDLVNGVKVNKYNDFTKEWLGVQTDFDCPYGYTYSAVTPTLNHRCYISKEPVEGGSVMGLSISFEGIPTPEWINWPGTTLTMEYYSRRYSNSIVIVPSNVVDNNIVMRSDRLPTSTMVFEPGNGNDNSYVLHSNPAFSIYMVQEDGFNPTGGSSVENGSLDGASLDNPPTNPVLTSFTCGGLVPLECYYNDGNSVKIQPSNNGCYKHLDGKKKMEKGCYVLVTTPIITILEDFSLITEWLSRLTINFAACRNIFGHMFSNNWINGSLYAFSFKNNRFYDNKNRPYSKYCNDTVFLDKITNNFYYRCSPYDGNKFIGKDKTGNYGGNEKNLLYPTTIMDLGPRDIYTQELVLSNEYDGYTMNKLNSTTYGDVSELLNLFLISRLSNLSFIQKMIGGASVNSYFSRGQNSLIIRMIDGDYAQMNSINSELGVASFEPENYPDVNQIYYNGGSASDGVFGIFFSSDTQIRDYVTPKRTIIVDGLPVSNSCSFESFAIKSQRVPFYQWDIKVNSDGDSIFGSQSNDWYSDEIDSNGFFSYEYQSLDRLYQNSRYVRTNNVSKTNYYKGYIYSVDGSGNLSGNITDWNYNTNPNPRAVTVGSPFHFYFGLKKGKSAFDRFASKWVNFNNITN